MKELTWGELGWLLVMFFAPIVVLASVIVLILSLVISVPAWMMWTAVAIIVISNCF